MPYTTNPHIGKVRAKAVRLIKEDGWSRRAVARHLGVSHSTVVRWMQKAPKDFTSIYDIPTESSRPKTSPNRIDRAIEDRIVEIRLERGRCAQVIHAQLKREDITVSLSTVKRVLDRRGLIKKRSPWKKTFQSGERPKALHPGQLVQMDTVHIMQNKRKRMYIFTMIDVHSRWAYAKASQDLSALRALRMVYQAQQNAQFPFQCVQSDHGPEFGKRFSDRMEKLGIRHRHSRVRKPNDNAHVERFNRTIQEEMYQEIIQYKSKLNTLNRRISTYLEYYNTERLHLGIDCRTPMEVVRRC